VKVIVLGIFVATVVLKLQQFVISEPDKVCHRRRTAIQQVCQQSAPVATRQFVLAAHYDVSITSRLAKNIQLKAISCPNFLN